MTYSLFKSPKKSALFALLLCRQTTSYFRLTVYPLWKGSCFEFLKGINSTLQGHTQKPTVGLLSFAVPLI